MKLDSYLVSNKKNSSKWVNDLNIRLETIKLLEVDTKENLEKIVLKMTLQCLLGYNIKSTSN